MVIGLTGGIASGKSIVGNALEEKGFPVVDADKIAREVAEPGEDAYEKIVEHFGPDVLEHDGTLARKKLGKIIFQDQEKRQLLNQIMHPSIRKRMLERKDELQQNGHSTIIFDIPLLIENKLQFMVDKVLLVYVTKEVQLQRLMDRDKAGGQDAADRIASQMALDEKKAFADEVINNNGTIQETLDQLQIVIHKWKMKPAR
ncbi:dephospho-CoA kinase [Alteribacillus sp. HJP-4]|uniref:dephospho-CoA kinase n=1 Tax=Alteribacillus sp. HJP-4 TaxID=2775394 RepID=UPI0035CD0BE4